MNNVALIKIIGNLKKSGFAIGYYSYTKRYTQGK